jgi:hypothetical protein
MGLGRWNFSNGNEINNSPTGGTTYWRNIEMNRKRKILTVVALVEAGNVIETYEHAGDFKEP